MVAFKGTFDGRTIVLDGPRDAAPPQRVLVHVEPLSDGGATATPPRGVPGSCLLPLAGSITPEDLAAMSEAIREGSERVDPDAW
jgi:hypothetical protein